MRSTPYKVGDNFSVAEANEIRRTVLVLKQLVGDPYIQVKQSQAGTTLRLDVQKVVEKVPKRNIAQGFFPVLVWQSGGSTNGDKTHACDRTYQARTMDATSESTGTQLGTGLTPKKHRWAGNYGKMDCPASTGAGVVGSGYYDASGTFCLFDANETPDTGACT
jgi:hypothetical protein